MAAMAAPAELEALLRCVTYFTSSPTGGPDFELRPEILGHFARKRARTEPPGPAMPTAPAPAPAPILMSAGAPAQTPRGARRMRRRIGPPPSSCAVGHLEARLADAGLTLLQLRALGHKHRFLARCREGHLAEGDPNDRYHQCRACLGEYSVETRAGPLAPVGAPPPRGIPQVRKKQFAREAALAEPAGFELLQLIRRSWYYVVLVARCRAAGHVLSQPLKREWRPCPYCRGDWVIRAAGAPA